MLTGWPLAWKAWKSRGKCVTVCSVMDCMLTNITEIIEVPTVYKFAGRRFVYVCVCIFCVYLFHTACVVLL